jgi:hypothetical protein
MDKYVVNSGLADRPQEGNQVPIANNAGWAQSQPGCFANKKNALLLPVFELQTIQPIP